MTTAYFMFICVMLSIKYISNCLFIRILLVLDLG
jgi:hypothetical protein